MEAQVRFTDGATRSFTRVLRMGTKNGCLIISGWLWVIAVIPLDRVGWAVLKKRQRVSQDDFGRTVL